MAEGEANGPETRTGGEALVDALMAQGIDTIFGIPGIQLDNFMDAVFSAGNAMRFVHCRHEQGAAYMAMGAAQSTGRPAVYCVVPGPGFLNSVTALADAASANLPVLALTGQIPSNRIGQGLGIPHELKDQQGVATGIINFAARAETAADAAPLVKSAFGHMISGRMSPAMIEMAPDVMGKAMPVPASVAAVREPDPVSNEAALRKAAEMLMAAKRPLVMLGGGTLDCPDEMRHLAERIGAPVVLTQNARGVLPSDHPFCHHMLSGQELWREADLVLAIGTRFSTPGLAWGRPDLPVIRVDIDPVQLTRPNRAALEIHADAATAGRHLSRLNEATCDERWRTRADAIRSGVAEKLDALEPLAGFANAMQAVLPRDAIVVSDITQFGVYARFALPVYCPRSYLLPGYQATLGWAYPAALGAQVANPGRKVVTFAGDGGFLFNVQELATAVHHRIPVVAVVFDNGIYGNVKQIQAKAYGGRHIATELSNPDFVTLARSFGMAADRAENADELRAALERHLASDMPGLIHVPVPEDMPDVWSLIKRPPSQGDTPAPRR